MDSRHSTSQSGRDEIRHPVFARFFAQFSRLTERDQGNHRRELLAGLSGRVLEVGAGNGTNFRHYLSTVDGVIALEPEPYLRSKAEQAARTAPLPVDVRAAAAYPVPVEGWA